MQVILVCVNVYNVVLGVCDNSQYNPDNILIGHCHYRVLLIFLYVSCVYIPHLPDLASRDKVPSTLIWREKMYTCIIHAQNMSMEMNSHLHVPLNAINIL